MKGTVMRKCIAMQCRGAHLKSERKHTLTGVSEKLFRKPRNGKNANNRLNYVRYLNGRKMLGSY